MHVGFVHLGILEDLLDGFEGASEEVLAELEAGTGEQGVEIDPVLTAQQDSQNAYILAYPRKHLQQPRKDLRRTLC